MAAETYDAAYQRFLAEATLYQQKFPYSNVNPAQYATAKAGQWQYEAGQQAQFEARQAAEKAYEANIPALTAQIRAENKDYTPSQVQDRLSSMYASRVQGVEGLQYTQGGNAYIQGGIAPSEAQNLRQDLYYMNEADRLRGIEAARVALLPKQSMPSIQRLTPTYSPAAIAALIGNFESGNAPEGTTASQTYGTTQPKWNPQAAFDGLANFVFSGGANAKSIDELRADARAADEQAAATLFGDQGLALVREKPELRIQANAGYEAALDEALGRLERAPGGTNVYVPGLGVTLRKPTQVENIDAAKAEFDRQVRAEANKPGFISAEFDPETLTGSITKEVYGPPAPMKEVAGPAGLSPNIIADLKLASSPAIVVPNGASIYDAVGLANQAGERGAAQYRLSPQTEAESIQIIIPGVEQPSFLSTLLTNPYSAVAGLFDVNSGRTVFTSNILDMDTTARYTIKLPSFFGETEFTTSPNPKFDPREIRTRTADQAFADYQQSRAITQGREGKGILEQIFYTIEDAPKAVSTMTLPYLQNVQQSLRQQTFVMPLTFTENYGGQSKTFIKQTGRGWDYVVYPVEQVAALQVLFAVSPHLVGTGATWFAPPATKIALVTPAGASTYVLEGGKAAAYYFASEGTKKATGILTAAAFGYIGGWETTKTGEKKFNVVRGATSALAFPLAMREFQRVQRGQGLDIGIKSGDLPTGEKYASLYAFDYPVVTSSGGRMFVGGRIPIKADASTANSLLAGEYKLGSRGPLEYRIEKASYGDWLKQSEKKAGFPADASSQFWQRVRELESSYDTAFKRILNPQKTFTELVKKSEAMSPQQKQVFLTWVEKNKGFLDFYYGGKAKESFGIVKTTDFDIMGKPGIESRVQSLYTALKSTPGPEIRMPDVKNTPGLFEVRTDGKFAHLIDIHWEGMPAAIGQQPSQFILGRFNTPAVFRATQDGVPIIQSGSEFRQMTEAQAIFTALPPAAMGTSAHRAKDLANFYLMGQAVGQPESRLATVVRTSDTPTLQGAIARFTEKGITVPAVFTEALAARMGAAPPAPPVQPSLQTVSAAVFSYAPSKKTTQTKKTTALPSTSSKSVSTKLTSAYASISSALSRSIPISPSPSRSLSPSRSPSRSVSPSLSRSLSPSRSPSGSPSVSLSPSRSPSRSVSPSLSRSLSPSRSPSRSPSPSSSPSTETSNYRYGIPAGGIAALLNGGEKKAAKPFTRKFKLTSDIVSQSFGITAKSYNLEGAITGMGLRPLVRKGGKKRGRS